MKTINTIIPRTYDQLQSDITSSYLMLSTTIWIISLIGILLEHSITQLVGSWRLLAHMTILMISWTCGLMIALISSSDQPQSHSSGIILISSMMQMFLWIGLLITSL
uniref:Uncharacterized protein n=1 Tax=viral metagenome TaxID=1070528 RepID=A0A6C0BLM8_9ZZZZ